jgi:glycosyltransferase involved in cell wall biosynthesis
MSLSAVVIAKNEEQNIEKCLDSLVFCDEILLIDDFSSDRTVETIQKLKFKNQNYKSKVKIFRRGLNGNFAAQRNFGLKKAAGDWVLFVDADERVTPSLRDEITKLQLPNTNYNGFYIKRQDFLWGEEVKYSADRFHPVRLAKKESGVWQGKVHEVWEIKGKISNLKNSLTHYPHPTLRKFIEEINFYSTIRARELDAQGKKSSLARIVLWPKGKFLETWIVKRGFLNGTPGFVISLMMGLHSFLAWSKLWVRQRK